MGGGGGTQTTAVNPTLPPELRAVTQNAADIVQAGQADARFFFQNINNGNPFFQNLAVAPLTPLEQQMQQLGFSSFNQLVAPGQTLGVADAERLAHLDPTSALLTLAGTNSPRTQAEQLWSNLAARTPGDVYQQVGVNPQQTSAGTAFQQAVDRATGSSLGTPSAETQALNVISSMTGGPLGASPATQEAIQFLENQYQTRSLPALQNQLATAGLGRSGALEQGITDLRGQLLGSEAQLLQNELVARQAGGQEFANIAQAQTGRQEADITRAIQGLLSGGGSLQSLGGQLAGQAEQDIGRIQQFDIAAGTGLIPQEQFQQEAYLAPVNRQLATIMQGVPELAGLTSQQLATSQAIGEVAKMPRELQQQMNLAKQQEDLRLQALAEEATIGVLTGMYPSSVGQTVTNRSSGGGFLGLGK